MLKRSGVKKLSADFIDFLDSNRAGHNDNIDPLHYFLKRKNISIRSCSPINLGIECEFIISRFSY